ncbi:MAG TPA: peptide deformylase [Candidatus Saccharimonadales bacterium]|nr:peptide deformylase [Candidatus Saccharimonadales bacterium]
MSKKDLIITLPNEHLRQKSKRISVITDEVRQVIDDMKAATLDWEATRPHEVGVALAAIQLDEPYRIIVIRNNFEDKKDRSFSVFINPEVVKFEGDLEEDYEGCLSVADVYGKVPRYSKVRMRALDEQGRPIRVKAEGFLARILQHEIDHTVGIMFVDHIKDKQDAFFKLTSEGKLASVSYGILEQTGIFRD